MQNDLPKTKRIFVGFDHAGAKGIYEFTRVLKKAGYRLDFYGKVKSPFKVPVDINLEFSDNRLMSLFQAIGYFFRILPRYDVWHFNYGQTFFICPLNLLILKLWGKKIICTFRGNDVIRNFDFLPPKLYRKAETWPSYYVNLIKARFSPVLLLNWLRMQSFLLLADQIILIGPWLSSSVWRYDEIIPYTSGAEKKPKNLPKKRLRIFHAPTDKTIKGTAVIERAFKKLARQYPEYDFILAENLNHRQIKEEMLKADIIVDQLLVGWYGEQAAEAMAMGKTVMAYLHPTYLNLVDFGPDIPIINTNYWTFERDLKRLLQSAALLPELGRQSYNFSRRYHFPRQIAAAYLKAYGRCYH